MPKYYMECLNNESIETQDATIVVKRGNKATTIPISSIQEFQIEEPTRFKRGSIRIHTAKGDQSYVRLTNSVTVGFGAEIRLVFTESHLYIARLIQKYIAEYGKSQPEAPAQLSSADELRKYKSLLDDGIISQEEFESKKKQLLGI